MKINNNVVEAIGNTPLIKLNHASEATGCTILGKAEFMNPGQSVKDRAGKWMILEAEKRGELKPGGLVVESTAGNTGIGLAVVASARGPGNAGGANGDVPASWSATRTRPLCPWPKVARYKGSGSVEDAANFSCQ